MRRLLMTVLLIATAAPAYGGTIVSNNFDSENGGAPSQNYAGFSEFDTGGGVDLLQHGVGGISCAGGSGGCVDLDANVPGRGLALVNNLLFAVGDRVNFSFSLSGSQVGGADDDWAFVLNLPSGPTLIDLKYNVDGTDVIVSPYVATTGVSFRFTTPASENFRLRTFSFVARTVGHVGANLSVINNDGNGPIVDNYLATISPSGMAFVPEPATWGMMILGFGFAGGAMRVRKRSLRFATATA
jgi:PEP-CTERM motif